MGTPGLSHHYTGGAIVPEKEFEMLWFATWSYGRPTLCRVRVQVRKNTYKVVEYETYFGFWAHTIVFPKTSPHLFATVGPALAYLKAYGMEVEQNEQDKLRTIQAHNQSIGNLIAELEETGKVNFGDDIKSV